MLATNPQIFARASQKLLCLEATPPPQMNQERVAGLAGPRQTGNTLFYSFWGGEGKRKKTVETPEIFALSGILREMRASSFPTHGPWCGSLPDTSRRCRGRSLPGANLRRSGRPPGSSFFHARMACPARV